MVTIISSKSVFQMAACCGLALAFAAGSANAQSATQKSETTTETTVEDTTTIAPTEAVAVSDLEKELDPLLIGPWSKLASSQNTPLTNAMVESAVKRCASLMTMNKLQFGPGTERTLPKTRSSLVGDVVYFRTSKGIQRLDASNGIMAVLPKVEKAKAANGREVWQLSNNRFKMWIHFADTSKRGGKGEFMASNDGIYLRCIPRPAVSQ